MEEATKREEKEKNAKTKKMLKILPPSLVFVTTWIFKKYFVLKSKETSKNLAFQKRVVSSNLDIAFNNSIKTLQCR